ncbi:MAG: c-type cytochrome [Aquificae bacterium]|nr:c-type cytochrome [Aquificota bacterium]
MRVKYVLLSALLLGAVACEQPKKEQTSAPAKEESVAQKVEQTVEKVKETAQEVKETAKEAAAQVTGGSLVEKGKKIFQQKGCNSCHQPEMETVGPSLKKIAQAYGSVEELVKYLKGEAEPKVDPAKANIMNPQLAQLKDLSEEDLKALAEYILSFK